MALDEAAGVLGVSVAALERRIKRGDLPEATLDDDGYTVASDALSSIADREGWIIDLRDSTDPPSNEFTEMLEQLLSMGSQLTAEVTARKVAEHTIGVQVEQIEQKDRRIVELENVIEELDAENSRVATDLQEALVDLAVADALAVERNDTIADLQDEADASRERFERDLGKLRGDLQAAHSAMGWWSRRRLGL